MPVTTRRDGPILVVTLDRPDKRNAMNAQMTAGLDAALNLLEDEASLRCAVLTGAGQGFCAGTDLAQWAGDPTPRGGPYGIAGRTLTKPVIAAVEGVAAGGGMEIVLACTLVVAGQSATFSLPETGLGLVAECGGLFRALTALPRNVGTELLLTGASLSAERAYALGLVNRLAPDGEALPVGLRLAHEIAARSPVATAESMSAMRAVTARHDDTDWAAAHRAKTAARASADAREGVDAFLSRRPPHWPASSSLSRRT